jgi:NhaA family Na+:H+ antiporter
MPIRFIRDFLKMEAAGGIVLFMTTIMAFIWANSVAQESYQIFLHKSAFVINDGLITLFFLVVTLELKREFLTGELSQLSRIALPFVAAMGGMFLPALIFCALNLHHPIALQGWSIPVATDIAFALGVLSLFGRRVPLGLKLFLMALAIFDDIGAIFIIAIFYSQNLSAFFLFQVLVCMGILCIFNRIKINALWPYLVMGVVLWWCLLQSGIHPTLAGVMLALVIPQGEEGKSPLKRLEQILHPWVIFLIMPLFALANAGFSLETLTWEAVTSSLVLGIAAGLFVGKQAGIFCCAFILIKMGRAQLPAHTSWLALYGVAILCGIGFTMSLFLGTLSFQNENALFLVHVRMGVIMGSLLSAIVGAVTLWIAFIQPSSAGTSRKGVSLLA